RFPTILIFFPNKKLMVGEVFRNALLIFTLIITLVKPMRLSHQQFKRFLLFGNSFATGIKPTLIIYPMRIPHTLFLTMCQKKSVASICIHATHCILCPRSICLDYLRE